MNKQIKTKHKINDHFIREIRISYLTTDQLPIPIKDAADVAFFVRSVLLDNSREHLVALYLDGAHKIASYSIVSIGTANLALISPREVFQRAVIVGAISLIVAHNHPSGNSEPSDADREITKRLSESGNILGIPLLDHVIVTDKTFYSLKENMNF